MELAFLAAELRLTITTRRIPASPEEHLPLGDGDFRTLPASDAEYRCEASDRYGVVFAGTAPTYTEAIDNLIAKLRHERDLQADPAAAPF